MNKYPQETVYVPTPQPSNRQYLHTTTAGAWLPLAQATITGAILGLAVLVIGLMMRTRHPENIALVVGLLTWAATWLLLQRHWYSLTDLEKLTGIDLDGNGTVGRTRTEPPPEVRVRISEVKDDGHFQQNVISLPASLDQLQTLAAGLLAGDPFSERTWTGSGRPFSVNEFRALRTELLKRGLLAVASPKDARQGYVLTAVGRQGMRCFMPDSPTPTQAGL